MAMSRKTKRNLDAVATGYLLFGGRRKRRFGSATSPAAERVRDHVDKAVTLATGNNCSLAMGSLSQAEYWRGRAGENSGLAPSVTRPAFDAVRSCFAGNFKKRR